MRKLPVANSTKNTFFDFSAFSTKVDGAHPNTNSSEKLNSFFFRATTPVTASWVNKNSAWMLCAELKSFELAKY